MKTSFTLNLSDEFRIACILFRIRPEEVLQHWVNCITLPSISTEMTPEQIMATDFFIEYVKHRGRYKKPHPEEQKVFLRKKVRQRTALLKNRLKYSKEEGEEAIRYFYTLWLNEWESKYGDRAKV